jgi:hypothetical protein
MKTFFHSGPSCRWQYQIEVSEVLADHRLLMICVYQLEKRRIGISQKIEVKELEANG